MGPGTVGARRAGGRNGSRGQLLRGFNDHPPSPHPRSIRTAFSRRRAILRELLSTEGGQVDSESRKQLMPKHNAEAFLSSSRKSEVSKQVPLHAWEMD